jgi:hypothetical protein
VDVDAVADDLRDTSGEKLACRPCRRATSRTTSRITTARSAPATPEAGRQETSIHEATSAAASGKRPFSVIWQKKLAANGAHPRTRSSKSVKQFTSNWDNSVGTAK